MNISFVLAVYNNFELTKDFYKNLRDQYPTAKLIISDGGSTDQTKDWLKSLNDDNLEYVCSNEKISFSENYNNGIKLVKTDKLVLVHNDMIIGEQFLENLDKLLKPEILLSYTTIEPPIFAGHRRPGKIILDLGTTFENFEQNLFKDFVKKNKDNCELYDGAVFFMSGYKSMFEDVGYFDGQTFFPCFCEDDDFLIRAKLKGYSLKTTECAITYHFVSKTSRFGDDFKNIRDTIELNSNRNFIRKWGMPISSFNELNYNNSDFTFKKINTLLKIQTEDLKLLSILEPFFTKINCYPYPELYIQKEKLHTNLNLDDKFKNFQDSKVIVELNNIFNSTDLSNLMLLEFILQSYPKGKYTLGNFIITIL